MRTLSAAICILLLLGAAVAIVALEEWHGPVVLTLSSDHGVDTGDLAVLPLLVLAIAIARSVYARPAAGGGWAVPGAAALALGALLLFAGVVSKSGGGPLVPAGGGTLDGAILQTSGTHPVPVGRWSDVALTYDGARLRMYIDGTKVSSRAATGTIQTPGTPLWIGGNQPYGEHFRGLIDEVRVYDHALGEREVRADMGRPVGRAAGLAAAYAFDAGSGRTAADSSGSGNAGTIREATWARGRYGDALRFDGTAAVVRVAPSASLDLTKAMTLSAWIRPSAPQSGWRTIVQRQADAYLLTAGSDRLNSTGAGDDVRAALLVAAAVWFCLLIATGRAPSTAVRRRSWYVPVALFAAGSLADAALTPSATLIGPALVALWLAATAAGRTETAGFLVVATLCGGLTLASLTDVVGPDSALTRYDGAVARTAALGALFVIAGLVQLAAARRATSASPATRR
jgi:hypothetical protein